MYIIEAHGREHATTKVIMEKGDEEKTYEEFSQNYRTIKNHLDGLSKAACEFCRMQRRAQLLRERRAEANS